MQLQKVKCPTCGHETVAEEACADKAATPANEAAVPPEVAGWKIEHASPDLLAWARQTFDLAEYLAGVREIEQTGGGDLKALIEELKQEFDGRA